MIERLRTDPPGNPMTLGQCVILLDNAGRKEEARALYASTVRRFPNVPTLKMIGAGLEAGDGNLEGALRLMRSIPPHERPGAPKFSGLKEKLQGFFRGKPGNR
ncbi:MAG TPA: hypothetical protein VHE55_02485 [Fimbriimonadaceae bacterium]|nr:hypothetical protein [Fimbriimonadaceae bacterium]